MHLNLQQRIWQIPPVACFFSACAKFTKTYVAYFLTHMWGNQCAVCGVWAATSHMLPHFMLDVGAWNMRTENREYLKGNNILWHWRSLELQTFKYSILQTWKMLNTNKRIKLPLNHLHHPLSVNRHYKSFQGRTFLPLACMSTHQVSVKEEVLFSDAMSRRE